MSEDDIFAPTIARIRIVNHNKFVIMDRCDNVRYEFRPGVANDIPIDAARHLFGFHLEASEEEVKAHCCKRFGWNSLEHVKEHKDEEFFNNLDIAPVHYRMVEVEPDGSEVTPLKRGRGRPRKDSNPAGPEPSE